MLLLQNLRQMKIKLLFATLLLCVSIMGCEDEDVNKNASDIIRGTWKCVGFGNSKTDKIKLIEPKDCKKCYILTFEKDGIFEGRSVLNGFKGNYKINDTLLKITKIEGTKIGEMGDAGIFIDGIYNVHSALFTPQYVHIYYSKTEYLLFNRKTK